MSNMCHVCGAKLTNSREDKDKHKNENSLKLNGDPISSCKLCGQKHHQEALKWDDLSSYPSRISSPPISLTSSDSTVSSCSEFSVDINSYGRVNQDESTAESRTEDASSSLNGHVQNSNMATQADGIDRSNTLIENSLKNNGHMGRDVEISGTNDGQEGRDTGVLKTNGFSKVGTDISYDNEKDAIIWEPPEPEDDMECSMANSDDDDEFGDGTKWGQPSSLCSFGEEGSGSYKFRDEKQKAMEEVINGKFKTLVNQLLKSVGVASSGKDGESWVDIVTSLSWEAASFVKPDAIEGKAMDPDGYVKVKCIAVGSRNQSQVIKGLVFKKHAAHKHMQTRYKNPRLLLIQGMLGHSSSGLSSFNSMDQEKGNLNSVREMIDVCRPNVVLVEKTVSRDVQETFLEKGVTLVFDMKLHRLERVARCTGSPIMSPGTLMSQKLKHCDSFHFEKFVEEHASVGEGGKKPSKTLMFIEGCPTRQGCTILLKGTHSEELKRVKCVMQCAVVMAYHLILETSFLVDQKAMFSTIPFDGLANLVPTNPQFPVVGSGNSSASCLEEPIAKDDALCLSDVPVSNGFLEGVSTLNLELEGDSSLSYEPYNPVVLSGLSSLSASIKKVIGDNFPIVSSTPYHSLSSYFGLNGKEHHNKIMTSVPVLKSPEAFENCDMEAKSGSDEEKSHDSERPLSPLACSDVPLNDVKSGSKNEDQMQSKDDISTVLDSQSILVLMSSRNASKGRICEQSHFSHIKFYRNFDVPLGKFLQDNLLNQKHQCPTCGELPEAHFYYYAHCNKQITIQVKQLPTKSCLPGEAEGKLWMWSRCGKCKPENGITQCTKRVLISTAARGLSFGKFLELSFSQLSSPSRVSSCGHFFHRDFLYFFGLGPMVAVLGYSPVSTYAVAVPPHKLEFSNSIRQESLKKEMENVYMKAISLFTEVANALKKIASRFAGSTLNLGGSLKEFSDVEEMLSQERYEFEVNIQKAIVRNGKPEQAIYKLLSLNRLLWELQLESCLWDRRLHALLLPDSSVVGTSAPHKAIQGLLKKDGIAGNGILRAENILDTGDKGFYNSGNVKTKLETRDHGNELSIREIPVEGPVEMSREQADPFNSSTVAVDTEGSTLGYLHTYGSVSERPVFSDHVHSGDENCKGETLPSSDHLEAVRIIPITGGLGHNDSFGGLDASQRGSSHPLACNLEKAKGWIWSPFPEIRRDCMKDLQGGFLPKFESISSYTPEYLPSAYQLIIEEGSRLHIPLGTDDYIVSDYEGELSSIISCALALLKDVPVPAEDFDEGSRRERGLAFRALENSHSLNRITSMPSSHWHSNGSVDSDGSVSSEESLFSSFDGFNLLDSLVSYGAIHPEVSLGAAKSPGKGKYSVVCLYANQFRNLRDQCCPSELDYIASLSRCRNWDAKGGKSKSFFAKTLDDRFIIKEIKKTEFESFMKFAPDYFAYMNHSFTSGSQTCLAKILGIYQVIIRQTKSGKEMRHDLMVMENLTFCRSITRQYDLKGALHARYNSAADGPEDVLLDQNFVNDMNTSPVYVSRKAKRVLQRAVWNDTTFLNSINVMDYSLLVGVDTQRHELVCGIIDYLRQYTWDKQLETWVKSSLVVPKNVLPTVISPKEYKKRFRKFMSTYFFSVPDHWCSQRSSNPCELCGIREDESSSQLKAQKQGEQNGFSA